jgi:hypothetical protein
MRSGSGHNFLPERGISPGISVQLSFDSRQAAIQLRAHFYPDLGSMALRVHKQAFVAIKKQLNRAAGSLSQQGGMNLAHNIFFAAETAAHQLANHPYSLLGPTECAGHLLAILVRDL